MNVNEQQTIIYIYARIECYKHGTQDFNLDPCALENQHVYNCLYFTKILLERDWKYYSLTAGNTLWREDSLCLVKCTMSDSDTGNKLTDAAK